MNEQYEAAEEIEEEFEAVEPEEEEADPVEQFHPRAAYSLTKILFILFWVILVIAGLLFAGGQSVIPFLLGGIAMILMMCIIVNAVFTTYQFYNRTVEQNDRIIELLSELNRENKE